LPTEAQPDLHQAPLLRRLVTVPARSADAGADEDRAVAFFDQALQRAGFLRVEEVVAAVGEYAARNPAWRDDLLEQAHRICHVGLPVYSMVAGPLTGGFDWSAPPQETHNDRLYRLRPHRFGFLPRLAIAASLGADTLTATLATLERWIAHVDKAGGAADAYFSNLVVIYRLLAISWAVPFIAAKAYGGDRIAAAICLRMFQIVAADIRHLQPRFGRSAANNHLLADRFAAWFVAICFRELCPKSDAGELERSWLDELGRQFQADGTNFEQSVHYHELGCEMAVAYLTVSLRLGVSVPASALSIIARMLRFQAALADVRGNGFGLGDATDDPLMPLDVGESWAGGAWRMLYRTLFDASFPPTKDDARGAERAFWLQMALRDVACPVRLPEAVAPLGDLEAFPVNGYVVFRDDAGGLHALFRTGPQSGAKTSPGHAMSDLLTVYWNAHGRPLLEPSGTFSYAAGEGESPAGPARSYFRGPAAHNGLVLRGHDPLGMTAARFRETDSGARVATRWRSLQGVLGWAEGKMEERGPLNGHRRGMVCVPGRYAIVYDRLPAMPDGADIACHWQLAPEADVTVVQDKRATIRLGDTAAYLCASDGTASLAVVRGREAPPGGWVSRRYGGIEPASQLICQLGAGTDKVAFGFGFAERDEDPPRLQVRDVGAERIMVEIWHSDRCDVVVIGGYAGRLATQSCDVDVCSEVLWLRFEEERCVEMRALGLRYFSSDVLGLKIRAGESSAAQSFWTTLASEESVGELNGRWRRTSRG
jgi:hypothetical protein